MLVSGLTIPSELETLLTEGRWPRTADEAAKQNLCSLVAKDRRRALRRIYLYAPPFHTLAQVLAGDGGSFYFQFGALQELIPESSIVIGDFGLGSDAPILLDYRNGPTNPRVLHLEWSARGEANSWAVMAASFAEFVAMLGL